MRGLALPSRRGQARHSLLPASNLGVADGKGLGLRHERAQFLDRRGGSAGARPMQSPSDPRAKVAGREYEPLSAEHGALFIQEVGAVDREQDLAQARDRAKTAADDIGDILARTAMAGVFQGKPRPQRNVLVRPRRSGSG